VAFGWAAASIAHPTAIGGLRRHPGITRRATRARSCGPGAMASWPPWDSRVVRARRDGVLATLRGAIHNGRPHRITTGAPPAERACVACCAARSGRAPAVDRDAEGGARIVAPASRRL